MKPLIVIHIKCQILGDDEKSLNMALHIIDYFAGCSGLRANFDKTQVLWFGAKRGCGEELKTQKPIIWNHEGTFKLLGIEYEVNSEDSTGKNYKNKIKSVKNLLNDWSFRSLSLIGKVCIIKTLALPIFIQIFTVLPVPSEQILKEIETIFFDFIWDKKGDKIKRSVMINNKDEGGLQVPHIPSFCAALKTAWLKKILNVNYFAAWKTLLIDTLEAFGGDKVLYLSKEGIFTIQNNLNTFWINVFEAWAKFELPPPTTPEEVMSQTIWSNKNIKRNGRSFIYQSWLRKGIYFINDLLKNDGRFMSFAEFRNQYQLEVNFVDYYSVIEAVPLHWKRLCRNSNKIVNIIHPYVTLLKNSLKTTKPFYQLLLKKVATKNTKAYSKWHVDLNLEDTENWSQHFAKLYSITDDSKLLNFHFKLFHRIIFTNSRLFKCRLIETELCTFCNEQRETLLHLFYDCSHVRTFLLQLQDLLRTKCNINFTMAPDKWMLNQFTGTPTEKDCQSMCAILAKHFIYCCKMKNCLPDIRFFKHKLKSYCSVELYAKSMYSEKKAGKITARWSLMKTMI